MGKAVLREVLANLERYPIDTLIYVPAGEELPSLETHVQLVPLGSPPDPGRWRYLLGTRIAKEVIEVWSEWREGRVPSLEDALEAVLHYAENDAYLPAD